MAILTPTEELNRILIARADSLAGAIVTLPIVTALRGRLPDVEIAMLVCESSAPIVRRIAEVDHVLVRRPDVRLYRLLRAYGPDAMIFAHADFRLAMAAVAARVDVRIGSGYRWFSGLFTRWVYDHRRKGARHASEHSVNLLAPLLRPPFAVEMPGLPVSSAAALTIGESLEKLGVRGDYVVVVRSSIDEAAPSYDPERMATVTEALRTGWPEFPILDISVDESGTTEIHVVGRSGVGIPCDVDQRSELYRGARFVLGVSSGELHLAALVATPVVGLYPATAPAWPARWRPIGDRVATLVPLATEAFCDTCERRHPPETCVSRIEPSRIVAACSAILEDRSGTATQL